MCSSSFGDCIHCRIPVWAGDTGTMPQVLDVLMSRRSDRHFSAKPLEREVIDTLIEAFRWAPSSNNRQPWRLLIAESAEARAIYDDALSDANRLWAPAAPLK